MDPQAGPLPHYPKHPFGLLLRKGNDVMVYWRGPGLVVEPASPGSASVQATSELRRVLLSLAETRGARTMLDVVRKLEAVGYVDVGMRMWKGFSYILYQDARRLADLASEAHETREAILARHGGRHPVDADPEWNQWILATVTLAACAHGARALGASALEALVDEILSLNFPEEYSKLSGQTKPDDCCRPTYAGMVSKLNRLKKLAGFELSRPDLTELEQAVSVRKSIIHPKPGYEDEIGREDHSVEMREHASAESALTFLDLIDRVFEALFAGFGVPVPEGHRPGFAYTL